MGECERMWGRREALPGRSPCHHAAGFCTRFGSPYPVLPFFGLVHQHMSQSRFFFFDRSIGSLHSRRSGHSPQPVRPFFFLPMRIRSLRGRGWIPPNQVLSLPRSCAAHCSSCPASPPPLQPLHFSLALPPCFSALGHPYLVLRMNDHHDTAPDL
jgi:hypothetical protein